MKLSHLALKTVVWLSYQEPGAHEIPENVLPRGFRNQIFDELAAANWIVYEPSLGDMKISLLGDGHDRAQQQISTYRSDAAAIRMLKWVEDHADQGSPMDVAASEFAQDFTGNLEEDLFDDAQDLLLDMELIDGIKAHGGHVLRPSLTVVGRQVLRSGYSPLDYGSNHENSVSRPISNTFHGSVGAVQQGDYNQANVSQVSNENTQEVVSLISEIRRIVQDSNEPESTVSITEIQLDAIEAQLPQSPSRKIVDGLLSGVVANLSGDVADSVRRVVAEILKFFS